MFSPTLLLTITKFGFLGDISKLLHLMLCLTQYAVLHDAIYLTDSFVLVLSHCLNLNAIRCNSASLNRIVADKSDRVTPSLKRYLKFYDAPLKQSPNFTVFCSDLPSVVTDLKLGSQM